MKSKFDYEIENFSQVFLPMKNKKIVLYGTGRMTATLLGGLEGFNIVGLCDRDEKLAGKEMYGKRILNRDEVEQLADIVVINTSEAYWNTIYRRISHWNIPIYYCNGVKAEDKKQQKYIWNKNISCEKAQRLIDQYQIVSFDIFDTLVLRKLYYACDLFRLTELKIHRLICQNIEFVELRKKAASECSNPTLDEIYIAMGKISGLPQRIIERMKQIEIETDLSLLAPREEMVDLCRSVMKKQMVYFVSDMYYSVEIIQNILLQAGLAVKKEQIIVSCEYKSEKADGSLWDYYKREIIGEKSAIHIGDNENSDYTMPIKYGIKAIRVRSASDMLNCSSIGEIIPHTTELLDSIVLGLISAKLFNNPFLQGEGDICFEKLEDAGYCLLGAVVYSFIAWILKRSVNDGLSKLLFFSREGYFLVQQYQYMVGLLQLQNVPEAVELEISRRAVWGASIQKVEDIYEVAMFPYLGSVRGLLGDRFGLTDVAEELDSLSASLLQQDSQVMHQTLAPYEQDILIHMQEERHGYLQYIKSLNIGDNFAVVDSQFYGSTQFYLGKLLKRKLKGYYFCACLSPDNRYLSNNEMEECFGRDKCMESSFHKYSIFLEAFFTAPHGMLIRIEEDGSRVYAENMSNQRYFDTRIKMNKGILTFIKDLVEIQGGGNLDTLITNERFADRLFEVFMDGGFEPSQIMKDSFFFDNGLIDNREVPVWE